MPPKKSPFNYRHVWLSLVVSVLLLTIGWLGAESISGRMLSRQLLWPLVRLMAVIACGLAVGELIEASGWSRRLGLLARPAFRFANLGDRCGAAFSAAFFSGTAANTMLAEFHRDGKITTRQLFLANLLNHFPAYFLHLPTTFFIVLPLTGKAGALYFLLTFSALLLRCAGFLLYGHCFAAENTTAGIDPVTEPTKERKFSLTPFISAMADKLPYRLAAIAVYVIPVYILVFILNALGLFSLLQEKMAHLVSNSFIPLESLSLVILGFTAEFTSGFAAAGALLDAGAITLKQTVLALLIGNIIAFPLRAIRHQLPRYVGIFSPRRGLELLLLGQGLRVLSLMAVGTLYYLL
ncbi:MAG: nucleoside recognition protein [Deltaproteobacteria bacterium]|nr:nucleoside recognition protein [Deltaproteobacteria bacterium]